MMADQSARALHAEQLQEAARRAGVLRGDEIRRPKDVHRPGKKEEPSEDGGVNFRRFLNYVKVRQRARL